MESPYRVQIIDVATGEVVYRELPGLTAEVELIANLQRRVLAKGVGLGRTSAHVVADVGEALTDLLSDLKRIVPPKQS